MKTLSKILLLGCVGLLLSVTNVQRAEAQRGNKTFTSATNASGLDTVTNAGAKTQSLTLSGYWTFVTIQVDVTKISGTVGGSIVLQGNDGVGTKYVTIGSAVTPTDATASYVFSVAPSNFAKYRVVYTGASTMAASVLTSALYGNPPKK